MGSARILRASSRILHKDFPTPERNARPVKSFTRQHLSRNHAVGNVARASRPYAGAQDSHITGSLTHHPWLLWKTIKFGSGRGTRATIIKACCMVTAGEKPPVFPIIQHHAMQRIHSGCQMARAYLRFPGTPRSRQFAITLTNRRSLWGGGASSVT